MEGRDIPAFFIFVDWFIGWLADCCHCQLHFHKNFDLL